MRAARAWPWPGQDLSKPLELHARVSAAPPLQPGPSGAAAPSAIAAAAANALPASGRQRDGPAGDADSDADSRGGGTGPGFGGDAVLTRLRVEDLDPPGGLAGDDDSSVSDGGRDGPEWVRCAGGRGRASRGEGPMVADLMDLRRWMAFQPPSAAGGGWGGGGGGTSSSSATSPRTAASAPCGPEPPTRGAGPDAWGGGWGGPGSAMHGMSLGLRGIFHPPQAAARPALDVPRSLPDGAAAAAVRALAARRHSTDDKADLPATRPPEEAEGSMEAAARMSLDAVVRRAAPPTPASLSGVGAGGVGLRLGPGLVVQEVVRGSVSDACGMVAIGDAIVAVDGVDVTGLAVPELRPLLCADAPSVTLTLLRPPTLNAGAEVRPTRLTAVLLRPHSSTVQASMASLRSRTHGCERTGLPTGGSRFFW
jgi:hypothetical protein